MTTQLPVGTKLKADEFTSRGVFVAIDAKVVGAVVEAEVGPTGYVTRQTVNGLVTEHGAVTAWRTAA